MAAEAPRLVGALVNGLKVMRYLAKSQQMVGVNQVARELDLHPSTAFNLLRTLVHERLAVFEPDTKTYGPGPGLTEFANGSLQYIDQRRLVHPHLRALADKQGMTVILLRKADDEHAVLIDIVEATSAVRVRMDVGRRLPLYLGAMGRCFAAHSGLSKEELKERFKRLRWDRRISFERYYREVEAVKETGIAVDENSFEQGVTSIAAPILDANGRAVMALSAVGISAQLVGGRVVKVGVGVRAAASDATRAIGGQPF